MKKLKIFFLHFGKKLFLDSGKFFVFLKKYFFGFLDSEFFLVSKKSFSIFLFFFIFTFFVGMSFIKFLLEQNVLSSSIPFSTWMKECLEYAEQSLPQQDKDLLTTSCINTAFFLSILLLGKEKASSIMTHLGTCYWTRTRMELPSGNFYYFIISNLYAGRILSQLAQEEKENLFEHTEKEIIEKRKDEYLNKYDALYMKEFLVNFQKELFTTSNTKNVLLSDEQAIQKIHSSFLTFNYSFNERTMNSLQTSILQNQALLSSTHSFLYFIGISLQQPEDCSQFYYEHVFILEQFSPLLKKSGICFQLYDSWCHQATLLDSLKEEEENKRRKTSFTEKEFWEGFWEKLKQRYIQGTLSCKECYGYENYEFPLLFFSTEQDILSGLSLRYITVPISYETVNKNVKEFVKTKLNI